MTEDLEPVSPIAHQRNVGENRAVLGVDKKFIGSVKKPRIEPPPGSLKECGACHEMVPIETFGRRKNTPDLHEYYCKPCLAARASRSYNEKKRKIAMQRWHRMGGTELRAAVSELLESCAEARRLGMWRGREAIRAYKRLGDALDAFHRDGEYRAESMEKDEHRDIAPAADADFDTRAHATPQHIREALRLVSSL